VFPQTRKNDRNAGGQFVSERSVGARVLSRRGRGTEGGDVVHLNAAKYKHNAGPRNHKHNAQISYKTRITCYHQVALCAA
jgi:hypothetical protein